MSDDIRSLIRAAQEAEGRREPLEAAGHLQRAAERLERSGRPERAVQLLRHAVRLSGDEGLKRHLETLERDVVAAGPPPPQPQGRVYELDVEDADGELPFRPPPGTPGALNPRPHLSAVPTGEPAAAGPAAGVTRLQAPASIPTTRPQIPEPPRPADPGEAEPPARTYRSDAGVGGLLLAHHVPVLGRVEVALSEGMRVVLLLGPQGSGRSTCLSALAARLGGVIVGPPFVGFPPAELLLIDDAHRLEAASWAELERTLRTRPKMRVVLAAPRSAEATGAPMLVATSSSGEMPLWTTAELLEAAPGLPPSLAGRVEQVVEVALPLPAQLERLARELLSNHRPQLTNPGPVAKVLVEHTLQSPRGLHELIALVHRLPMDVRTVRRRSTRAASGTTARSPAKGGSAKRPSASKAAGSSTPSTPRTPKAGATGRASPKTPTRAATRSGVTKGASETRGEGRATTAKAASTTGRQAAKAEASKPVRAPRATGRTGGRKTADAAEVGRSQASPARGGRAGSATGVKTAGTRGSKKGTPSR